MKFLKLGLVLAACSVLAACVTGQRFGDATGGIPKIPNDPAQGRADIQGLAYTGKTVAAAR